MLRSETDFVQPPQQHNEAIYRALPTRSNLLPCPFCGCKEHRWGNEGEHISHGYEVRCDGCPAEVWGQTRDEATAAWNRRVSA